MKKISWITHKDYDIPLPKNHKFTASKFSDLYKELKFSDFYHRANILSPEKASVDEVSICHDLDYVLKIKNGNLSDKEIRRLGFNWSERLSKRSFLAVNGTLLTCKEAIKNGIANHLAGGTHHSHKDYGSGYCLFNDTSYASLHLLKEKLVKKILIFDTDVHQGDGTASILQDNKDIFTCSIHCKNNFPFRKSKSDLDVELDDNLESMNQSLSSLKSDGDDQTHLVVAEMEQQGKMRESNLMDSDTPSKDMTGTQGDNGYEWLEHNSRQYFRQVNEPASDWEEWNAPP